MVDEHGIDDKSKGLCDEKTKHCVDKTRFWKSHENTEQFRLWVLGKKERRRESASVAGGGELRALRSSHAFPDQMPDETVVGAIK